jgi:hypothetical protein
MQAMTHYLRDLNATIGAAWNRFWFTPTPATTLGLVRLFAGLLSLFAVATYGPDLERWFGEDGMLPNELIAQLYRPAGQWLGQHSLLDFVPPDFIWPVYWASLSVICLYTLGVGGRAIAIAAAVVTISFFTRAPLLTGEFEAILSFILIYLCIGRCTDAFSIASLWQTKSESPQSTFSIQPSALNTVSLRLIQIHLAIAHLMIGFAQLAAPESAWWSGEGVWLAIARPGMSLVDLSYLADHPRLVAAWSHAMTLYLLAFPVLVWNRFARPLMLLFGAAIWISFAVASGWVPFCAAMLTGLIAFVDLRSQRTAAT